jgi:hypothetical protein
VDDIYQITVAKGEEVKEKINQFILERKWEAALILGGIGSVRDVRYSVPVGQPDNYRIEFTEYPAPAELVSFSGEIMKSECMDPDLKKVYGDGYILHAYPCLKRLCRRCYSRRRVSEGIRAAWGQYFYQADAG